MESDSNDVMPTQCLTVLVCEPLLIVIASDLFRLRSKNTIFWPWLVCMAKTWSIDKILHVNWYKCITISTWNFIDIKCKHYLIAYRKAGADKVTKYCAVFCCKVSHEYFILQFTRKLNLCHLALTIWGVSHLSPFFSPQNIAPCPRKINTQV